jgi:predicted nucleic acid-binding protein
VTLVVDASVAVPAALTGRWPVALEGEELVAPTLLWSETTAALRELEWRREVSPPTAKDAIAWLATAAIRWHASRELIVAAHDLARALGWAKTYDAEYVVLAQILRAPLVTADARLQATARRFITVRGPDER